MKELFLILVSAVLVNNYVLARFLGLCPFFGCSKKGETAIGMGMSVTFVLVLASSVTWAIWNYMLVPGPGNLIQRLVLGAPAPGQDFLDLTYLKTIAYILVIAVLVQAIEMFLLKNNPSLYQAMGVFLPLITTNCCVLGVALINTQDKNYGFAATNVNAFGVGIGFGLALVLMAGIRERLDLADVPPALKGFPIAFITAGLMAMAFLGFSGMITE